MSVTEVENNRRADLLVKAIPIADMVGIANLAVDKHIEKIDAFDEVKSLSDIHIDHVAQALFDMNYNFNVRTQRRLHKAMCEKLAIDEDGYVFIKIKMAGVNKKKVTKKATKKKGQSNRRVLSDMNKLEKYKPFEPRTKRSKMHHPDVEIGLDAGLFEIVDASFAKRIKIKFKNGIELEIECDAEQSEIEIRETGMFTTKGELYVRPSTSNVIRVGANKREK